MSPSLTHINLNLMCCSLWCLIAHRTKECTTISTSQNENKKFKIGSQESNTMSPREHRSAPPKPCFPRLSVQALLQGHRRRDRGFARTGARGQAGAIHRGFPEAPAAALLGVQHATEALEPQLVRLEPDRDRWGLVQRVDGRR